MQPTAAWTGRLTNQHALVLTWSLFQPQERRIHHEGHRNNLLLHHSQVFDGPPARQSEAQWSAAGPTQKRVGSMLDRQNEAPMTR